MATLTADDIPQLIESEQFKALPFDQRSRLAEEALAEGADSLKGNWNREAYQQWGQFADRVRSTVSEGETLAEKAKWAGGVAGQAIKDMGAMIGTAVAGASPVLPVKGKAEMQMPGATLGKSLVTNMAGLVTGQAQKLTSDVKPLQTSLEDVRKGIDNGAFFDHPQGLPGWLDEVQGHVKQAATQYYGADWADWADQNGLLTNPQNAELLNTYLRTRSPEAWTALQKNVERTPAMAQIAETQRQISNDTTLGRALATEARPLIAETADPAELIPGLFVARKGAQAVQRGLKAADRLKAVGKGVAAEVASEQVSGTINDPNLTLAERMDIAKQTIIASLGLMGTGAALGKTVQTIQGRNDNVSTTQTPGTAGTPAPGAAAAPGGVASGNPFEGPIEAPPQPTEDGGIVAPTGPRPVPAFQDNPLGTLAPQPAGGNVIFDFGIPRTPEAQAAFDERQREYAASQASAQGQINRAGDRMPMIPDNPLGYRDILDFVNDNPLHIPVKGSEGSRQGEYDWTQGYEMPRSYRRYLATSQGGHNADVLAQMAYDGGYIQEPTPDALIAKIDQTIRERQQYRFELAGRLKEERTAAKQATAFGKAQQTLQQKDKAAIPLGQLATGDQLKIDGEPVTVRHVDYDQDGYATNVVLEDGKRFGLLQFDPQQQSGIFVDEWKPRTQTAGAGGGGLSQAEQDPFMRRSRNFTAAAQPGLAAASSAVRATGQPAGTRAAEAGGALPAASPMAVMQQAYAAATQGSSTRFVPISRVYAEARKINPALTSEQFMSELQSADHRGEVFLEPPEKAETVHQAGTFVLRNASGIPSTNMMLPQAEEVLAMAAPAVPGPLPSTAPHVAEPGGYPATPAPNLPAANTAWSGKVQTLHGIRQFLLDKVGLPAVGVRRFTQQALGIYKAKPEAIRLQAINDIPVLAHEIGHHLHYKMLTQRPNAATLTTAETWGGQYDAELMPLGRPTSTPQYTPDMVRKEGVAEFTRLWLTNPVQARAMAPTFSAVFESDLQSRHPEMADGLREAQAMIADYIAMPAFEKAKAQVVFDPDSERQRTPVGTLLRKAYAQFVNTLQPALDVVSEAAKIDPTLEKEAAEVQAWMENHRGGWASKAGQDVFGQQTNLNGAVVGPGLQTILKDLRPGENTDLSAYLALKRAQEIERSGRRSGFEQARLPAAEMAEMAKRFEPIRQKLLKWQENELQLLIDSGLMDKKAAADMRAANRDYVPFYRLYEKLNGVSFGPENSKNAGGYVDLNSGIRALKGSDRAVIDPLQSMMKNAFMFRKIAEQNHIGVKFFDLVRQVQGHGQWGEGIAPKMKPTVIGHDTIVNKLVAEGVIKDASMLPANADLTLRLYQAITKPDTKNGEVIIFKDGKREHWEVKDPLLMQALKTADADAVKLGNIPGWLLKIMTAPTKVLRWGATGGPWFAIPNFIRDSVQGGVMSRSRGKGFVPFLDSFRGGMEILRKGNAFERWKQAGGEFSGVVTGTQAFTRLLEDALPKDPLAQRAIQGLADPQAWRGGFRNALKLVGAFGQFTEQATRVGEFMRAREAGLGDREAANLSKVVSLNFARAGEISRVVNQFIPFFNATIQGLDQLVRAHTDPKVRTATVLKGLTYITLPSLLTWALGKDDEEIQNLPDYRKNLFWNINLKPMAAALGMPEAGFILSIPKPFLLGAIYGTSVERLLDYATGRDPNGARKAAANILGNTINPFEVVTSIAGLRPIIEAKTNFNLFTGQPIVPQGYSYLPPEQQYNTLTSETAKILGKWTGQSPMMIDHLLRGYFATAGKFGTDAIDYGMAKLALTDVPPPPRKGWMELPILNRFAGSPYAANAFVSRFYKATEDMEGKLAVLNKQAEQMTTSEQQKWWQANKQELGWYLRTVDYQTGRTGAGDVRKAQASLREINAAMKEVQASRVMTPDAKRARLLELAGQRNEMAENAFKALFPPEVRKRHY